MKGSIRAILQVALTAAAFGATGIVNAVAQPTNAMTDLSQYLLAPPPPVQGGNHATITQNGSGNSANSDVTAPGGSYFGNMTVQTQVGANNSSSTQAVGNSNALIATQVGVGNTSSMVSSGNNSVLTTTQVGNGNSTSVESTGNNNNFNSVQIGNGLSFSLQRAGNGRSVSVTQVR